MSKADTVFCHDVELLIGKLRTDGKYLHMIQYNKFDYGQSFNLLQNHKCQLTHLKKYLIHLINDR